MTTHHFSLPFGVEQQDDNAFRFKLWAPAAREVTLVTQTAGQQVTTIPMLEAGGWFIVETEVPALGDLYGFSIDGQNPIPDPVSRFQPNGVHQLSQIVDSHAWQWRDDEWRGRPWKEAVIYELHLGTFTPQGTYRAAAEKLGYLRDLGVTAIELMPLAAFPGDRGWGYDGVLPYAPCAIYGSPNDLKFLIDTAHQHGIAVILDVVYNHFGPEGNYLAQYAPDVKSKKYPTEWGEGFNFESPHNGKFTREFFINNALYWFEEYRFDGLRLDATQAIVDASETHVLQELAERVQAGTGQEREVWLIQENYLNIADSYQRSADGKVESYHAQWNDDFHRVIEVVGGGEKLGVYRDFADQPEQWFTRILADGFGFQGQTSKYSDETRGSESHHLPPLAYINFIENHDQVANRPFCARMTERLSNDYVRVATEVLLLMPTIPMLFMGQEWGASSPFTFFCDLDEWIAPSVSRGRKKEVAHINGLTKPLSTLQVPDPSSVATFAKAMLKWDEHEQQKHADWLALHKTLLSVRNTSLVPLLAETLSGGYSRYLGGHAFYAQWQLADGRYWSMLLNLDAQEISHDVELNDEIVYQSSNVSGAPAETLPGHAVIVYLSDTKDKGF